MQETRKLNPALIALIVIVLIGAVVTAAVVIKNGSNDTTTTDTTQTQQADTETTTTTPAADSSVAYKDGTYTETGSYSSPGGRESIEVTLTVAGDIITSATVTANATSGEAKQYQADFISGFKDLVVGKDIDEVNLSRVAGSSLTSNGFNAALESIKADAQA